MREKLTIQRINKYPPPPDKSQVFVFDTEAPRLAVRITKNGARSFIFETKLDRKTIRRTIGPVSAWTIEDARKEADRLQNLVNQGIDPNEQDREQKEWKAKQKASEMRAMKEAEDARKYNLGRLLALYADHLEKVGKGRSAASARSAFKVHVPDGMACLPAKETTRTQITEIIRLVWEKGKDRTAGILRAYLHAAYELAMATETDSAAPAGFIPFGVEVNPVRGIKTIPISTSERALTIEELTLYMKSLNDRPADIALKVALLAGGQRMEQLLKATPADWDHETGTLLLLDGKGKRQTPRKHFLPLAGTAAALVNRQAERAKAQGKEYLFFSEKSARIETATPGARQGNIRCHGRRTVQPARHPPDLRDAPCQDRDQPGHQGTASITRNQRSTGQALRPLFLRNGETGGPGPLGRIFVDRRHPGKGNPHCKEGGAMKNASVIDLVNPDRRRTLV